MESITSHNTVHFIPDGAPLTAQEITEHFDRERRICPANSRFKRPMAPVMDKRKLVGMGGQLKAVSIRFLSYKSIQIRAFFLVWGLSCFFWSTTFSGLSVPCRV